MKKKEVKKQKKEKKVESIENYNDEARRSITEIIERILYVMPKGERMAVLSPYCNFCGGLIMELFSANEKEVEMMCDCDLYSENGDKIENEYRDYYGGY